MHAAYETYMTPSAHHIQLPIALAVMLAGYWNAHFCSLYYYTAYGGDCAFICLFGNAVPVWVGCLMLGQSLWNWRFGPHGCIAKALNIIGAGLGMSLAAVAGFSVFCTWTQTDGMGWTYQHHCMFDVRHYEWVVFLFRMDS